MNWFVPQEETTDSWSAWQQHFECEYPKLASLLLEYREWLMTEHGQMWLYEQFANPRFAVQRKKLRVDLEKLP